MFEYIIFENDKGVPIDTGLDFGEIITTRLFSRAHFFRSHSFPCRSLLLSTILWALTTINYLNPL